MHSGSNRLSGFHAYQAYHNDAHRQDVRGSSVSDTSTTLSGRTSLFASSDVEGDAHRQSQNLLAPGAGGKDSRLSEFYDSYYRNSYVEPNKQVVDRQSAIVEVNTPLASPIAPSTQDPGTAM